MHVIVWITEGTWQAAVDAARDAAPAGARATLLHVTGPEAAAAAHGALAGLLGRGRRGPGPEDRLAEISATAAAGLLAAAARRLDRPADRVERHGRVEHEVVRAAAGADLLVCARDGDRRRPGPHSLAPPTRFVVDHAPCAVLLVWPDSAGPGPARPEHPDPGHPGPDSPGPGHPGPRHGEPGAGEPGPPGPGHGGPGHGGPGHGGPGHGGPGHGGPAHGPGHAGPGHGAPGRARPA